MDTSIIFGEQRFCGKYDLFYENIVPFTHAKHDYVFFHSSNGNTWFVSAADNLDFSRENALSAGSWSCFFEVLKIFNNAGNTFLFAHSSKGKRWQTMMFDENTHSFNKVVHDGCLDDFYKNISIFDVCGEPTILRMRSRDFNWFASRLFDAASRSFKYPMMKGTASCFYDVFFHFSFGGECYIFTHGRQNKSLNIYKFSDELDFNKPLVSMDSEMFYDNAIPLEYNGKIFICAVSSLSRRYCCIKISESENGIAVDNIYDGVINESYENIISIPGKKNTWLFHRRSGFEWIINDINIYETPSWQQGIADNKSISDLNIPGTHDSCANLSLPYGKCQRMNIDAQLENGIRFLDIRCRHINNSFTMHHDIYYLKQNFDDVLDVCRDFLEANPSEFIIFSVKEEYKPEKNTRNFEESLLWYIEKYSGLFYTGREIPLVGEVRGKLVLLSRYGSNSIGIDASEWYDNAVFASGKDILVQDAYYVPLLRTDKWDRVLSQLELADENSGDGKLYLNYCSGTNAGRADAPKAIARNTNKKLYEYCLTKSNKRYGILVFDYPELPYEDLIRKIIDTNFR